MIEAATRIQGLFCRYPEVRMNNTITLWRAEHAKFAKLIDLLEAQLALFHAGEPPNYELMLSIAFYMTHYVDAVHHAREEIAFRRIRQREPRSAPTIDALTAQHAEMKVDGEALAREFEDIVDGTILARSEVEALGRRYIDGFRAHMKCEDDEVIPLAGTVLTDQDWHTINAAIAHVEDPIFGVGAEQRYAALRAHIARESRGPTLE